MIWIQNDNKKHLLFLFLHLCFLEILYTEDVH